MKQYNYFITILIVFLLSACATTGSNIDTQRKAMALADAQLTAVVNTAADLRVAGIVDDITYDKLDIAIKTADSTMDLAWIALGKGNVTEANNNLQMVNTLLWNIRAMIPQGETP